ncbi:MAG: exodeoxyribonuclease V subunit beta [Balneola sp.]
MKPLDIFNVDFKGFNLVEASAGTGKTYNITSLYIRALIEQNISPSEILVLTFTEDATSELKQRIRSRIQECIQVLEGSDTKNDSFLEEIKTGNSEHKTECLKKALFSFDEAVISTIHGFCQKLLREYSIDLNVQSDFEIVTDTGDLLQESVDSFWKAFISEASISEDGRSFINFLISEGINPDSLSQLADKILNKSYAVLKPDQLSEKEIQIAFESIKSAFTKIQERWEEDKDHLNEIIFSGKMHGSWYKQSAFLNYFNDFEDWIKQSVIPFTGFEKLSSFGTAKIRKGANKGYEPDLPLICEYIDDYLLKVEKLDFVRADFLIKAIKDVETKMQKQKDRENVLSFDDLLQTVNQNLTKQLQTKIAEKYPVALIDEFQDTDPVQYSIFKKIFEKSKASLFMIGDPKQAIYSFRGADLFTYFRATEDVRKDRKYSLNYNYRSTQGMISAVNKVFGSSKKPFVYEEPTFRPAVFPDTKEASQFQYSGNPVTPFSFVDCEIKANKDECTEAVCNYVSEQVSEFLNKDFKIDDRFVQPKDIAVLVRRKKEGEAIQNALSSKGIKSTLKTRQPVFKTKESEDLYILLKAATDNSNISLVRAALATSFIGFTAHDLLKLKDEEEKWTQIVSAFINSDEVYSTKGLLASFKILDSFFGIRENLAKQDDPERRLTNLDHLLELLSKREQKGKKPLKALLRYLIKKSGAESAPSDEELIRLESDSDLVNISTLHSSKGLEYPIVFVPFLWDKFDSASSKGLNYTEYHDESNRLCIDLSTNPKPEVSEKSQNELLADSLRLNYVAFTRAKYACIVPFTDYSGLTKSALFATLTDSETLFDQNLKVKEKEELLKEALKKFNTYENSEYITASEKLNKSSVDSLTHKVAGSHTSTDLSVQKTNRQDLFQFKRILSFSSLSSSHGSFADKDYDEFELSVRDVKMEDNSESVKSRLTFPRGVETGNLLHYIFEDISFSNDLETEQIVLQNMNEIGINAEWKDVLLHWVYETLNHSLKDEIKLKDLDESSVLKEMEFHFPVNNVSNHDLLASIRNTVSFNKETESVSGYMKGFIDLIFKHDGKYYILDYKSNFLGDELEEYHKNQLREAIILSNYDLQYHIYTLALVKFLKMRIPDFSYESDFGGVFYLFMRGIDPKIPGSGVYFDKPDEEVVMVFNDLIVGTH